MYFSHLFFVTLKSQHMLPWNQHAKLMHYHKLSLQNIYIFDQYNDNNPFVHYIPSTSHTITENINTKRHTQHPKYSSSVHIKIVLQILHQHIFKKILWKKTFTFVQLLIYSTQEYEINFFLRPILNLDLQNNVHRSQTGISRLSLGYSTSLCPAAVILITAPFFSSSNKPSNAANTLSTLKNKMMHYEWMNAVLGHDSALLRLYWAGHIRHYE